MEYDNKTSKIVWRSLFAALSFFSFIVAIIALVNGEKNETYRYLFMLPLAHGIISFLCILLYDAVEINIVTLVFIGLYSLRNAMNVMLLAMTGFTTVYIVDSGQRALNAAVLLMSIETLVVFIGIPGIYKRIMFRRHKISLKFHNCKFSWLNYIFLAAIIFCAIVVIKYPEILTAYTNMFDSSEYINEISVQEIYGYHRIFTIFSLLIDFIKIMVAVLLINFSAKYVKMGILKIIIPLFSLLPLTLFENGNSGTLLTMVTAILWSVYICFPKQRKNAVVLFGGSVLVVLCGILAVKGNAVRHLSLIERMAGMLDAYLPGTTAVSDCIDMAWNHSDLIKDTFFHDAFYGWIPFITTGSSMIFAGHSMSYYFNMYYTNGSQIVPCIGQCFFYFKGFVVVPLLVYIYTAHYAYKKARDAENSYKRIIWLFLGIHLARTFVMMNIANSLGTVTKFFVLLWILSLFAPDKKVGQH